METLHTYITSSLSTIYLPSKNEIKKRIMCNIHFHLPFHLQLLEYKNLEIYFGKFYNDQLSGEIQSIVKHLWDNKKKILGTAENKEILSYLNRKKNKYSKILYHLEEAKLSLYENLSSGVIYPSLLEELLNIHIRIIYYSQLKQCIHLIQHRLMAILYI